MAQSEADRQNQLTEQGVKSAPVTDEASRQNKITGGEAGGQATGGK